MRIVLTGATGLIGSALGQELVRRGHTIVALVRNSKAARSRLTFPCEIYDWDGERDVPPSKSLVGADAVIHLAGENVAAQRWTLERKTRLRDSRIQSTRKLNEGLKLAGARPKVLITASGVGIYGDAGNQIVHEASVVGDDFLAELCQDWERAGELGSADRHVQLRFGVVLSPAGGFLQQVIPMFQRFGASRLGSGRQWLSWIHLDDAVAAIFKVLEDDSLRGPVNLVAPEAVTNSDMTRMIASQLKIRLAPPVPAFTLKIILGQLGKALLASQRAQPLKLDVSGFKFRFADFARAIEDIFPDWERGEMRLLQQQWIPGLPERIKNHFSDEAQLEKIRPAFMGLGYKKWQFSHSMELLGEGVLIQDEARFILPLGWFGRVGGSGAMKRDWTGIFKSRADVIDEVFYPH